MLWSFVVAAAVVAQGNVEKPMALDPIRQRQVFEAALSANKWAESTAEHLYPGKTWVRLPRSQQPAFYRKRQFARRYLTIGAADQICEAYGIDRKTLDRVVADPRSREQPFVSERAAAGLHMATDMRAITRPTKFNPRQVVLPDKIAAQIGYKNPSPDDVEPQPYMSNDYMPDGRRIPGAPHNPEAAKRRREIEKRAAEADIRGPVFQ